MHVCLFGYDLAVGASGAGRFVHDLATFLVDAGHEVTIATRAERGLREKVDGADYLWVQGAGVPGEMDLRFAVRVLTTFPRYRGKFDVIHSVSGWPRFALAARAAGVVAGVPVVHSALGPAQPGAWSRGLTVHSTSRANVERFPNAVHIPPFIDGRRFAASGAGRAKGGPVRIGVLGAPDARKGIDVFARMAGLAARATDGVEFRLAVAPRQVRANPTLARRLADVRAILRDEGIGDRATVLGDVDVPEFLSGLDVLVFPAQSAEGMVNPPLTVIEAMAAGCAIVASRVGGTDEVLTDSANALLVDASERGNPQRYAEHVLALAADAPLRDRLGQQARRDAAHYDVSALAPSFIDLYSKARTARGGLSHVYR